MNERYIHAFEQTFEFNGQIYDRLELIRKHGIVSPRYAREHDIPFLRTWSPTFADSKTKEIYDDVIFLFTKERRNLPILGNARVYVENLNVLNLDQMHQIIPGFPALSIGEAYVLGNIPKEKIKYE